jgi:hypothetical protein
MALSQHRPEAQVTSRFAAVLRVNPHRDGSGDAG